MGVLERYKGLISAAQRYAAGAGVKLSLNLVPDERHFPIVFHLDPLTGDPSANSPESLLFMFFPGETMLTSDVLNEVISRLSTVADAPIPVLLFAEDDLRLVRRALDASGLSKHAATHTYRYHAGLFECDWVPAIQPVEPQLVAS
jgi:hypothetical protein